jgi:AcrR family transcriptional regulator
MSSPNNLARNITEVRIVEAAVQLFSRNGFKGTSTRDIADLAKVNEATLFRHFGRKVDLFWAAADSRLERLKLRRELQTGLASDADPETVIPLMVAFITDGMFKQPELMRLLYVAGFELSGADRVLGEHLGPIFDAISSYFRRCASKGIIADVDPVMITLGLAGAVGAHHTFRRLFTQEQESRSPEYSRFLLNALQKGPAAGRPSV